MTENKIAIIGDKDLIEGFSVAGFFISCPEEDSPSAIEGALDKIVKENFSICFILERYASKIKKRISELQKSPYPSVVILPDYQKALNLNQQLLKEIMVRATGAVSV